MFFTGHGGQTTKLDYFSSFKDFANDTARQSGDKPNVNSFNRRTKFIALIRNTLLLCSTAAFGHAVHAYAS